MGATLRRRSPPYSAMDRTYASPSSQNLTAITTNSVDFASSSSPSPTSMSTGGSRAVKIIPLEHPSATASSTSATASASASVVSKWRARMKGMTWKEWIELFFPCYRWMRTYKVREYLQSDLMAGITVGIMLVPQILVSSLYLSTPYLGHLVSWQLVQLH